MQERLRLHPPVHWLAASYLGYKPSAPTQPAATPAPTRDGGHTIAELKMRFPGGVMKAGG